MTQQGHEHGGRRFEGRTAVVTGATSGIGRAVAERLAEEGAGVVVLGPSAKGEVVVREIREAGGRAVFAQADVSNPGDWDRVADIAHDTFGFVDVLVSNAARYEVRPLHETTLASWQQQLDVCLTGAFLATKTFVHDLVRQCGSLVVVSSVHAAFGMPGHPAYAAAKGALCSLTRQLAAEYGPDLRANCVVPGPILTPLWDRVSVADQERSIAETITKRFGRPDEVAAAVAFLASQEASFITGATLTVDGGWSVTKSSS